MLRRNMDRKRQKATAPLFSLKAVALLRASPPQTPHRCPLPRRSHRSALLSWVDRLNRRGARAAVARFRSGDVLLGNACACCRLMVGCGLCRNSTRKTTFCRHSSCPQPAEYGVFYGRSPLLSHFWMEGDKDRVLTAL